MSQVNHGTQFASFCMQRTTAFHVGGAAQSRSPTPRPLFHFPSIPPAIFSSHIPSSPTDPTDTQHSSNNRHVLQLLLQAGPPHRRHGPQSPMHRTQGPCRRPGPSTPDPANTDGSEVARPALYCCVTMDDGSKKVHILRNRAPHRHTLHPLIEYHFPLRTQALRRDHCAAAAIPLSSPACETAVETAPSPHHRLVPPWPAQK
jgi:hypothetical protein